MPQFDYQQLCHFVLPEQGGLSVETILKRFLHLTPREIRHAKYISDGIQKNGVSCRTNAVVQTGDTITFRYEQKCPHLSEDQVLPVSGDSAGVRILYEDSDLCVADKPSGMVCHASHGHYSDSLTHAAASLLKTPGERRAEKRIPGSGTPSLFRRNAKRNHSSFHGANSRR